MGHARPPLRPSPLPLSQPSPPFAPARHVPAHPLPPLHLLPLLHPLHPLHPHLRRDRPIARVAALTPGLPSPGYPSWRPESKSLKPCSSPSLSPSPSPSPGHSLSHSLRPTLLVSRSHFLSR